MKVALRRDLRNDPPTIGGSPGRWLTAGKAYDVLSIEGGRYRIQSEDADTPVLFDAGLFDVLDDTHPRTWVARGDDFLPERWAAPGFWVAFFDAEPGALEVYREEREKMK